MNARLTGTKRRWLISASIAGAGTALILLLFRGPTSPSSGSGAQRAKPRQVTVTTRQIDELALRDLAPLFLPTHYNSGPVEKVRREPGRNVFDIDTPKLRFADNDPGVELPVPFRAPKSAAEALAESPGPLAAGIGMTDAKVSVLPPHGAFIEVFSSAGEMVLTQALDVGVRPKVGDRPTSDWRPVEFMAAIEPTGLVGQLMLTSGSGSEDIDNHFRNYLAHSFRIGDRLTPGFYRIVVGP